MKPLPSSGVDDFYVTTATVSIVHPQVLDRLTQAFLAVLADSQRLLLDLLSDVYGLSSVANKSNYAPDQDVAFARQQLRPLTNAQLVESLLTALRVEAGERAKLRRVAHGLFLNAKFEPRYSPADLPSFRMVWLMNNSPLEDAIQRAVADADGELSVPSSGKNVEPPEQRREIDALTKAPTVCRRNRRSRRSVKAETFWRGYYGDVFWSLLNSGEFALNP